MNKPLSSTTKPIQAIQTIMDALLPHGQSKVSPPKRRFDHYNGNGNVCYLIQDGCIQLHRTLDGMTMNTVKAPMILGLSNQLVPGAEDFFFTTETVVSFSVLTAFETTQIIEREGLWEFVSVFQAYILRNLTQLNMKLTALTAY